jgi:hypothetical protein
MFKRTSEKWNKKYEKKYNVRIVDPDGWDRKDIDYSWSIEKITWKEFIQRAIRSSQVPLDFLNY